MGRDTKKEKNALREWREGFCQTGSRIKMFFNKA